MRGKAKNLYELIAILGITPAYAGKRYLQNGHSNLPRDHPRVCGEKTKKIP